MTTSFHAEAFRVSKTFHDLHGIYLSKETACGSYATNAIRAQRMNNVSPRKTHPREEASWRNMKSRCTNPKATGYADYGGRGISVCERWLQSFWNFYEDMGDRPQGTTLDRDDVNGNYEKDNCRWAVLLTQGNNKRDNFWINCAGEQHTLSDWARKRGLLVNTVLYRLKRGWSNEEALGYEKHTPACRRRLTVDDEQYVYRQYKAGRTQTSLGAELGIDPSAISRICSRLDKR